MISPNIGRGACRTSESEASQRGRFATGALRNGGASQRGRFATGALRNGGASQHVGLRNGAIPRLICLCFAHRLQATCAKLKQWPRLSASRDYS
jgi:hypothetical protein